MKQKTKVFIAFLIMFIVLTTTSQMAIAKEWTFQSIEDANKVWKIRFNYSVDSNSLSANNVYVTDGTKEHSTRLDLEESGKVVSVSPNVPYETGKQYRLVITGEVQSSDGEALITPVELPFQLINLDDMIQSVYSKTVNILTTVTVKTSPDIHSVKISGNELKYEGNNTFTMTLVDAKIGSTLTIYGYDENGKRLETKKYKIE